MDIEALLDDADTRQLMTFVNREPGSLGCYVELVAWLRPDLRLVGSRRTAAHEVLSRLPADSIDRRSVSTVRDLLSLVDRMATTHRVTASLNPSVYRSLRDAIGPAFNADAGTCVMMLAEIDAELQNAPVRTLVQALLTHYRDTLSLTKLIDGYVHSAEDDA